MAVVEEMIWFDHDRSLVFCGDPDRTLITEMQSCASSHLNLWRCAVFAIAEFMFLEEWNNVIRRGGMANNGDMDPLFRR